VRFSDGSPLRAADVVRSLRSALLPVAPSSIAATDDATVVVRLPHASQEFALLAVPISSPHVLGSGPYRIAAVSRTGVSLIRNPLARLPASGPDAVTFTYRADRAKQLDSLLAGKIDALEIAPRESSRLAPSPAISLVERPSLASLRLDLEGAAVPFALRAALATGIDREAIVAHVFDGHGLVASSVIPLGYLAWHRAPRLQPAFDTSEARALLEHEGWQVGADGIRIHGKDRAELRIAVDHAAEARLAAALVQRDARAIGIDVVFDATATARLQLLTGGPSPDALLAPLATGSRAITAALARARAEQSTAALARVYARVQERAAAESRAIPLAEPTTITAVSRARWAIPAGGAGILSAGSSRGISELEAVRGRPVSWSGWILAAAIALGALAMAIGPWMRARGEPIERAAA
jgi:ABC-type transport system substrate-binding protein